MRKEVTAKPERNHGPTIKRAHDADKLCQRENVREKLLLMEVDELEELLSILRALRG